ncbi:MAG: hypothetical protein J2P25_01560 [Nocardiopsaceae bacterium]|nr:hypothetical protein [Nocardiopsaceae bacterium]
MYIWTAPGNGTANSHEAIGISDDQRRAREAAETALRAGQADTACVERVRTTLKAPALSLCYIRTGTGWQARLGKAGHVEWIPTDWRSGGLQVKSCGLGGGRLSALASAPTLLAAG